MKGFRTSCSFSSPEPSLSQGWSTPRGRSPGRRPSSPICPLHPPRRNLEFASDPARRQRRHLPLEGLSSPRQGAWRGLDQADDAHGRRVHPPLSSPRAPQRLPPHPTLRLPRRPRTRRNHRSPAGSDRGLRPDRSASPRSRRERGHDRPRGRRNRSRSRICPCCGGRMRIIETFARDARPLSFTAESAGIDSS